MNHKLFFTAAFTWLFTGLAAQAPAIRFGLTADLRYANLAYRNEFNPPLAEQFNESATWRLAPGLAVWMRYNLDEKVSFQVGLGAGLTGYRVREFTLKTSTPEAPEPVAVGKSSGRIHYLDFALPVSVRFQPGRRFNVTGGFTPLFNMGRGSTGIIRYFTGQEVRYKESIDDWKHLMFRKSNVRTDVGLGYYFLQRPGCQVFIEPLFSFTLFPVFTDDARGEGRVVQLGVNVGVEL